MDDACSAERVALPPEPTRHDLEHWAEPVIGTFHCDVASGTWTWSDDVYLIHGFEPGEVHPTAELLLSHTHPDDLTRVQDTFAGALEEGAPFACYHRILDARRGVRHVLVVGSGETGADGSVVGLGGFLVDLTQPRRDDLETSIAEAVRRSAGHRPVIEQSKGALVLAHGIDPAAAFELLRDASQDHNVKLHRLADAFVARLVEHGPVDSVRSLTDDLLHDTARRVGPTDPDTASDDLDGGASVHA